MATGASNQYCSAILPSLIATLRSTGAPPRPEDFDRVIRHGLPGTSMTGLGNLLSDLLQAVIDPRLRDVG